MSKGWPRNTARTALSRAATNRGLRPLVSTIGGAARVPSGLSCMRIWTTSSSGFLAPAGGLQSCASRARKASSSLCVSSAACPLGAPSETVSLRTGPVAAKRCGARLSSSASTLRGSNFGCSLAGRFGGVGNLASAFFSAFLASSFLSASAIRSRLGSGGFFSTGTGGLGSGIGGGGSSAAALTSFFSTTLAVGSSGGFCSPVFSASGFGSAALGAFLLPAVIVENSAAVMMSTGSGSGESAW